MSQSPQFLQLGWIGVVLVVIGVWIGAYYGLRATVKHRDYRWAVLLALGLIGSLCVLLYAQVRSEEQLRIKQLGRFYQEIGDRIRQEIPKGDQVAFEQYFNDNKRWLATCATWVEVNMGPTAKAKLLDTVGAQRMTSSRSVNASHDEMLTILTRVKDNLAELIQDQGKYVR